MVGDFDKTEARFAKFAIVALAFPILLLAFHQLLEVPSLFIIYPLAHFNGHYRFWGEAISAVDLLPAGWGAFVVCKLIWPKR